MSPTLYPAKIIGADWRIKAADIKGLVIYHFDGNYLDAFGEVTADWKAELSLEDYDWYVGVFQSNHPPLGLSFDKPLIAVQIMVEFQSTEVYHHTRVMFTPSDEYKQFRDFDEVDRWIKEQRQEQDDTSS